MQVDITLPTNKPWYDKYRYDIPVLHLNGQYIAKHRIALQYLDAHLEAVAATGVVAKVNGDPNPDLPRPPTPLVEIEESERGSEK